jgi:hypothetical protein
MLEPDFVPMEYQAMSPTITLWNQSLAFRAHTRAAVAENRGHRASPADSVSRRFSSSMVWERFSSRRSAS